MSTKSVQGYRDLEVWQKSMDIAVCIYQLTRNFPKTENYGLCSQMQRAATSIPANIAEGRGRQHTKEFIHFLSIARGSLAELETYVLLSTRLEYISNHQADDLLPRTEEVNRMIVSLQRALAKRI